MNLINFNPIPKTELEIATSADAHERVILIRKVNEHGPIKHVPGTRILLIGNTSTELHSGFTKHTVTRATLTEAMSKPLSGTTYSRLYAAIMKN